MLRALEERDVRFVRLWFTDVLGFLKSVAVAPAELEGAFAEGIGFDGSAIEGFARVYESDMLAKPDPATFQILPWRGEGPTTARMFCDIVMPDGSPSYADPRFVLKRILATAADKGFTFYTHPEIEFYLFKDVPVDGVEPVPVDRSGFFDHTAQSKGSDFRREAITMLEAMGISVEFSHHEGGPGQQEIDLRYADALSTADNIMTFRTVIREVALSQGIWATFMPQPFTSHPGSGMHTHVASSRATRTPSTRPALNTSSARPAGSSSPASSRTRRDQRRHQPVGQQLQADDARRRGAVVRLLGPQQPLRHDPGADVQAAQGPVHAHRAAHRRRGVQPLPRVRGDPRCRHEGHRAGPRAAARGRGRRVVAHRARAHRPGHRAAAQEPHTRRSRSPRAPSCWPRPSASTSSTSSSATSARSGRSTAARSPPSSGTACSRSSSGVMAVYSQTGSTGCAWCSAS